MPEADRRMTKIHASVCTPPSLKVMEPKSTSASAPEGMGLGHHHLDRLDAEPPTSLGHVLAHRGLGHGGAVLVDQALPDAPRGVALLSGHSLVGHQPGVDDGLVGPEHRRLALAHLPRRRPRRPQRLAHRGPVHAEAAGEFTNGRSPPRRARRIISNNSTFDLDAMPQGRTDHQLAGGPPRPTGPGVGPDQSVKTRGGLKGSAQRLAESTRAR